MALYFILLGLGLVLYMFEYVLRMTLLDGLLTYGITGLWIAFNWFYLKPKNNKKATTKTE
jgi:hypothetical protein